MAGDPRNLIPYQWKPGQSGNPGGRPKGRSLTAIMRDVLDGNELCGQQVPGGRTVAQALIEAAIRHAIEGDAALVKEVLARIEGKPPESPPPDDVAALTDDELITRLKGLAGGSPAAGAVPAPGDDRGPDERP